MNIQRKLHFDDVMIVPQPSELASRSEVNLYVSYLTKHSRQLFDGLPIILANMDTVGQMPVAMKAWESSVWTALHKFYDVVQLVHYLKDPRSNKSMVSAGIRPDDLTKLCSLQAALKLDNIKLPGICIDAANAYTYSFLDFVKSVRRVFPDTIIMAGNVCTPEGVENVVKAGADIVKCGIAQGNMCETRTKTGIGYPQLSVAIECGQAANELNALACSDGGCKTPGDICKALGAGSHMVMLGSMFGGIEEAEESEWRTSSDNNREMLMYGMSSKTANEKHFGGLKDYRTSEGREEWIPCKGSVEDIVQDIKGGLASCCTYTNTRNLENLKKNCEFVRV